MQLPGLLAAPINNINEKAGNNLLVIVTLVVFSSIFIALAGYTVGVSTVQYDEFTDLVIASQLSQHPLSGHTYDGSQARFPMYVTAVAFRIMQVFNPNFELLDILPISRWFSILMIVPAIWGSYWLGVRMFNAAVGLFAATLFTFSPYVLHFGHAALTQGDAFTVAPVLFSLLSFVEFTRERTTIWLVLFSIFLSFAIAAKFFLVILMPAFITYHLILEFSNRYRNPGSITNGTGTAKKSIDKSYLLLTVCTGLLTLIAIIFAYSRFEQSGEMNQLMTVAARLAWGSSIVGIFLCFSFAIKRFTFRGFGIGKPGVRWELVGAWLVIFPLTFAMVMTLFPAHIFNREILTTLFERFITLDGNTNFLATFLESTRLYLGLLLLKLGLPFGITTIIAFFWAARKSTKNREILLIMLVLFFYALMLAVLPLQQPFWLMSIYPLILLTVSAFFVLGMAKITSLRLQAVSAGFAVFAFCWLLLGLIQAYPTFGYYGYETIGDRWLGKNSRGYAGVVVVTNDGSTEALNWLRQNVSNGSTVVSYLDDIHIINYLDSVDPFNFKLKNGLNYQNRDELIEELEVADYVVVRPIGDVDFPVPITDSVFTQRFGTEPVHQIFRGRGVYKMAVMQIYQEGHE